MTAQVLIQGQIYRKTFPPQENLVRVFIWTVRVNTLSLPAIKASLALLQEPCPHGLKLIKGMQRFLIGVLMLPPKNGHFALRLTGVSGAHRVEMNGGAQVGDVAVVDNRWHHVVAVLPSTTLTSMVLYVDGQAVGKSSEFRKHS